MYAHRYGWIAPGESISGLEDEYLRSGDRPKLIYVKRVEGGREPALDTLLGRVRADDRVSYRPFDDADELRDLVAVDLATLLSERFDRLPEAWVQPVCAPVPGVWGPLFGRERELAQATDLLDDPAVRLVTLVGPGGIGKSRLALELAHRLRARSGDEVAFVGLQGVDDHRLVAGAIAAALGLRGADERGAAVALLARLLETAPGLTLLVTSRVPLRLAAERCVPLSPLPIRRRGRRHEHGGARRDRACQPGRRPVRVARSRRRPDVRRSSQQRRRSATVRTSSRGLAVGDPARGRPGATPVARCARTSPRCHPR
ncbi:MAG: ATP-binding protein [Trueperaceae bacterium]|nr:MAG: ATP-binding protein [Trueperaceae bacterium]